MDCIKIIQLEVYAYHGCEEQEKINGQKFYIDANPNKSLQYHYSNSNPHCLFEKMVSEGICIDKNNAFELCWNALIATQEGNLYLEDLKSFIKKACKKFSDDL